MSTRTTQSTGTSYTLKVSIPQLIWTASPQIATAVNTAVTAWAQTEETRFQASVTEDLATAKNLPASVAHGNLTIKYDVGLLNAQVASFHFSLNSYLPGQADLTQSTAGLTFNLVNGKLYTLADLFQPGSAYLTTLATASAKSLAAFEPASHCYLGTAPTAEAANFSAFWLTSGGLVVSFPAGMYTAAYCGTPSVTLPTTTLRSIAAAGSPLAG